MKVTIYRKATPAKVETYDLDQAEFRRLAQDFEQYLRDGTPKKGIYRYNTREVKTGIKQMGDLILCFDEISAVG